MSLSKYSILPTRIDMELATLESPPEYEALLYAWGSTEISCATAYGSRDEGQFIDITESCSQAFGGCVKGGAGRERRDKRTITKT
jgi:hypothetical protein